MSILTPILFLIGLALPVVGPTLPLFGSAVLLFTMPLTVLVLVIAFLRDARRQRQRALSRHGQRVRARLPECVALGAPSAARYMLASLKR